jgi:NitT/TauT family transport system permease protein
MRALIAGKVQVAELGSFPFINTVTKGANARAILSSMAQLTYQLTARKGINSWKELSANELRAIAVTVFLVAWEIYGRLLNSIFMSYPVAIVRTFVEMTVSGELLRELLRSLQAFLMGFGLPIVLGIGLGLLMGAYRRLEYTIDPFINSLYATPLVALIPLMLLWVGLGVAAKVCIVFLVAFFPITVATYGGVKNLSGSLVEIGRAYGATERQAFKMIILPGAVLFIVTGIRLAVGRAVVGVIVAEFFTAINGLGGLIINYANNFETARMFVPVIVLALMGVTLTEFVKYFERKVAPWKESERAMQ